MSIRDLRWACWTYKNPSSRNAYVQDQYLHQNLHDFQSNSSLCDFKMNPTYDEQSLGNTGRVALSSRLWAHLGVNPPDQFSLWTASLSLPGIEGAVSAEFRLSADGTILIPDHLSNTTGRRLHMSQLIQEFLQNRGVTAISWLIILNIENTATVPVVQSVMSDFNSFDIVYPGSAQYDLLISTPLGRMASQSLAPPGPRAISVGNPGGLSMTFWVTDPPQPPAPAYPPGPGPAPAPAPAPAQQQGGRGCCIIL